MKKILLPFYDYTRNHYVLFSILFTILCLIVVLYVKLSFLFSYHPDISGSERTTTYGVQIVAGGLPLYQDPAKPPFWITHYSPLYYFVVGKIYRLIGWEVTNIHRVQLISRLVSFFLVLCSLAVMYMTLKNLLKVSRVAIFFAIAFMFCLLQHWYMTNSRIDSLLFFWMTVFIHLALRSLQESTTNNKYWLFAVGASVLALFSKQSAYMYIAGWVVYLVWVKEWKLLAKSFIVTFFLVAALSMGFGWPDMTLFFRNVILSLASKLNPWVYYSFSFKQLIPNLSVLLGFSFVLSLQSIFGGKRKEGVFLGIVAIVFFILSTGSAFKTGASVGYFHEFAYVSCLLILFCLFQPQAEPIQGSLKAQPFVILFLLLSFADFTATQVEKKIFADFLPFKADYIHQKEVQQYIEKKIKPNEYVAVLYGNNFRGVPLQQMLYKHNLAYQDDVIRTLYDTHLIDYREFYKLADSGKIKYFISPLGESFYYSTYNYHFNKKHYSLEKEIHNYRIYSYKP